jgi:hypothetical protein
VRIPMTDVTRAGAHALAPSELSESDGVEMSSPALLFPSAQCRRYRSLIYFAAPCASVSHGRRSVNAVDQ